MHTKNGEKKNYLLILTRSFFFYLSLMLSLSLSLYLSLYISLSLSLSLSHSGLPSVPETFVSQPQLNSMARKEKKVDETHKYRTELNPAEVKL
jgi:hypothetical protein